MKKVGCKHCYWITTPWYNGHMTRSLSKRSLTCVILNFNQTSKPCSPLAWNNSAQGATLLQQMSLKPPKIVILRKIHHFCLAAEYSKVQVECAFNNQLHNVYVNGKTMCQLYSCLSTYSKFVYDSTI